MKTFDRPALPALILAVGIALGGWFVGHGFLRGRTASRYVEVKGLAEREVAADLALWPLRFVSTGDDLAVTQAEITRDTREVYSFLGRHDIDTAAVQLLALEVSDAYANRFQSERGRHSLYDPADRDGAVRQAAGGHGGQSAGERAREGRRNSLLHR